ncbi:MAG TPA: penicillin acylase family protein, partial [Gammaproteobacteria bacterium]|nr:penicillin acylase family protein [Gammaproteobacteria bacterium]
MLSTAAWAAGPDSQTVARWQHYANNVTIYRDNWGIPHIYGKTNADTVFGMEYAQAEDGFARVERNYIQAL